MSQVLDYSLARPAPSEIKARGYIGVLRYVAPAEDAPKVITASEYAALRSAGLVVCLNWEWYGNRAKEGASAGEFDAQSALMQAKALGYDGPIYFSVDYDAPEADQPGINAYFQTCAQVIGKPRLGAYGGYWPLSRLFDAGLISYGWQTLAWSGTNRESRAHLYQNGATDFAGQADINDVLKANWAGGLPPVDYKAAQAKAIWGTTYPDTTGIHTAWLDAYVNHSIVSGPPLGPEISTVDWAGNPIQCQYFGSGVRIEYYVKGAPGFPAGSNHGYTATAKLW